MAPKSKFIDPIRKVILRLAEEGKTDAEIARIIGVNECTISAWKLRHPDFKEELKKAKSVADRMVEMALFQKATGFSHKAVKIMLNNKTGEVIEHAYVEQYPPDTTACIFWLKNRRPDLWRDVQERALKVEMTQLPSVEEAKRILEADYAVIPAPEVEVDDL